MKIISIHNRYKIKGGEDSVFKSERKLLEKNGNTVVEYIENNAIINFKNIIPTSVNTIWNQSSYRMIKKIIASEKPDIVHLHNFFPLISPAVIYAIKSSNIPLVQTLHNYRLWCLNAYFFRDGSVCEDCKGSFFMLPGVIHKCYRASTAASAVTAAMLSTHHLLSTWDKVDIFIALCGFSYEKFLDYGIPSSKLRIKPNFLEFLPPVSKVQENYLVYIGRLSVEKGISTLLTTWLYLKGQVKLKIAGSGPLQAEVETAAAKNPNIEYLGQQPMDRVYDLMGKAKALIFPSLWYEGMPRTIIESFAKGTPVIASNLGAMATMIDSGRTGLHFKPGNSQDLADKVIWMLEHPLEWQAMRQEARREFEIKYTAEENYKQLMSIYQQAQENSQRSRQ